MSVRRLLKDEHGKMQREARYSALPSLEILQPLHQDVEVDGSRGVKVELVFAGLNVLFGSQDLVKGILTDSMS